MFAREFPALVDARTRMPCLWRQFVIGLQVIGRIEARETIRSASAAGVPQMDKQQRQTWYREQQTLAGWR